MVKLKLIDDIKRAPRFAVMQLGTLFTFLFGVAPSIVDAWNSIPSEWKELLPQGPVRWTVTAAVILLMLARVFKLAPKPLDPPADEGNS